MSDDDGPPRRTGRGVKFIALVIAVAVVALAEAALQLITVHPWLGVLGAVVVAAFATSLTDFSRIIGRLVALADGFVRRRPWLRWVALGLAGALAAVFAVPPLWHAVFHTPPAFADGCPTPVELRVLTSVDGLAPARELARSYEAATAQGAKGCPAVHVFAYAAATSSAATTALARGWAADSDRQPLVDIGPKPDAWLPDSTVDVRAVRDLAQREEQPAPVAYAAPMASSPLVLVGPAAAGADATTWAGPLDRLLSEPGATLLAPDPETSSLGLLAAAGYLTGADGRAVPLPVARVRERAAVAGAGATAELLCQWAAGAPAGQALIVSEQSWRRYAFGDAVGAGCPSGEPAGRGLPYAVGPVTLDHPFVEFTWSSAGQRQTAERFREWLSGSAGADALKAAGYRPPRHECASLDGNLCVPSNVEELLRLYRQAQEPGRVLLALDASGSMAQAAAGATRFGVATRAVTQALGQLGPRDEFGVWTFGGAGRRQLAGVSAVDGTHRQAITAALRAVRPSGGTPLYDTIVTGLRAVAAAGTATQPRALVVVTDGEDTSSTA
ncbi:MAG: solute-binding protein, partial [Streptomycetaceae bacterium]|nr:solute-binding protein [Streptomycetaceae bacterium]